MADESEGTVQQEPDWLSINEYAGIPEGKMNPEEEQLIISVSSPTNEDDYRGSYL